MIVTIRDNKDYVRVLFSSYYTTITGWEVLLSYCQVLLQTDRTCIAPIGIYGLKQEHNTINLLS